MTNLDFEPSRGVRKLYLYTRKSKSTSYGGVILPGLFQTSQYFFDFIAFILVLFGEIYGFFQIDSRTSHGSAMLFVSLIIVDFILAFSSQLFVGGILKRKNELVLEQDPAETKNLRNKISVGSTAALFFKVGIFAIAGFKIVTFFNLKWGRIDQETILMTSIYIVVGILHVACTGYFGAFVLLKTALWYQENRYVSTKSSYRIEVFRRSDKLPQRGRKFKDVIIRSGSQNHSLLANGETWQISTWGILSDEQLEEMIWKQDEDMESKRDLALVALKHQLNML